MHIKIKLHHIHILAKNKGLICKSTKYINNTEKMSFECNKCGTFMFRSYEKLKHFKTCQNCVIKEKLNELREILLNNCYLLTSIVYNKKCIQFLCAQHDKIITTTADHIKRNHFCQDCRNDEGKGRKYTITSITHSIEVNNKDLNLKLIDTEYKDSTQSFLVECTVCDYQFNYSVADLLRKRSCTRCSLEKFRNRRRLPIDKVKGIVQSYNFILLDDKYINSRLPIKLKCQLGHIFDRSLKHVQDGHGCPECVTGNKNISELICIKYIEYLLDKPFNKSKTFDWLVNEEGNKLELDGYNDELKIGIEYDGKQHFEFVEHFHKTMEAFNKRQQDDRIKDHLCLKNGVKLIRVPYTVKYNDMLSYIKEQCDKLDINYDDKPDKSVNEFNLFNTYITKRNEEIDDILKGSIWERVNNFTRTSGKITVECNVCKNCKHEIIFDNLIKENRKLPDCRNCFNEDKTNNLKSLIEHHGWILLDKYTGGDTKVSIKCASCDELSTCVPRTVQHLQSIRRCQKCK